MEGVGAGPTQLVDLLRSPELFERILLLTGYSGPQLCRTVGLTCRSMDEFVCGRPALWHRYELRLHVEPLVPYVSDTIEGPVVAKEQLRAVVRHLFVRFTLSKVPPVLFATGWPQLRTLRLTGCRGGCSMTYCDMEALIGSTPKLEQLTLERCRIVDEGHEQRKASDWLLESCWPHLHTVALYDCAPEPAKCVALQTGNLRSLHVRTGGWQPWTDVCVCGYCERARPHRWPKRPDGTLPYYSVVGGGGELRQLFPYDWRAYDLFIGGLEPTLSCQAGAMYERTEEPSLADFVERNTHSLCEFVAGLAGCRVPDMRCLARCDGLRRLHVACDRPELVPTPRPDPTQSPTAHAAGAHLERLVPLLAGLEELQLDGLHSATLRRIFGAPHWPALRSLRLSPAYSFDRVPVGDIVGSVRGLRRLHAEGVRLDNALLHCIAGALPHLTHLELEHPQEYGHDPLYYNGYVPDDFWSALDDVPHQRLKCIERIIVNAQESERVGALRRALEAVCRRADGRAHAECVYRCTPPARH